MYQGDIRLGNTIEWTFTTRRFSTGAPFTLAGTPSLEAYETGNTTPITAGITLTVDYSSVTGLNHVSLVASSGNGFATATDVSVVIAAGTVDSVSVVGETIGSFSIENRSAVMPTTAGRTLDVSAGGEAGLDWANIGSPTTAQNLSATNIDVDQVVASVTGAVGSVTGAVGSVTGNVGGNVTGSVGSVVGNVGGNVVGSVGSVTAAVTVGAMNAAGAADFFTVDSGETYATAVTGSVVKEIADNSTIVGTPDVNVVQISGDSAAADALESILDGGGGTVTANITGNLSGSVGSVTGAVGSVTGNVGGNVAGSVGSVTGNVGGNVAGSVGSVTGAVGSVTGNVGGNVTGSVGSLATQAKAEVNAEVLDVLNVDTFAQPGQGTPGATTTIRLMLAYVYKAWRNRTDQNATTYELYNDDATTVDQKATVSDDGTTFTKGEVTTGP